MEKVLLIDKSNSKAVYRRAYSHLRLSNYSQALESIHSLAGFQEEKQLVALEREIEKVQGEYHRKEKSIYGQMFS